LQLFQNKVKEFELREKNIEARLAESTEKGKQNLTKQLDD